MACFYSVIGIGRGPRGHITPLGKIRMLKEKHEERYEERECVGELIRTANDMKN